MLTSSVSRRAGGLFCALPPLVAGIARMGCDVRVFSVADGGEATDVEQWSNIAIDVLARRGPLAFSYAPELRSALDGARLDVLHRHGLWTYPSAAAAEWTAQGPLVISPHGMLDPWAVRNAAWKKRIAGWLFEHRHLRSAACLHALNAAEHAGIRAYGLTNPVAVIPNGIDLPDLDVHLEPPEWAADLANDQRIMLFLGRLHPKKGLPDLLRAWAQIQHQPSAADWSLVIAGWDQGGHELILRGMVESLGLSEKVLFIGPQFDEQKAATFMRANAFVLPSLSEGLPMAVLEAWAYRLPVLMTRECNLPEGFAAGGAMEARTGAGSLVEALGVFLALSEHELRAMGARGHQLAAERFVWQVIAEHMVSVYRWLIGDSAAPECVLFD